MAGARPLVAARAFSAGVTFLIPLVLARLLALGSYGTFKQFFLVSHTLYFALALGIPQSLYYFLPRCAEAERRPYLGQTLLYLAVAGGLSGGALYLCTPFLSWVGGPDLVAMRAPMALYCGLLLGGGALEAGLTAQGRPGHAAFAYIGSDTAKMLAYVIPAWLGFGLHGVLWGGALYAALRALASWIVLVLPLRGPLFRRELSRGQLRYALPFGGAMLVGMPQQQLHQYVVSVTSSPAVFAVYSVGCFNLPVVDLLYTPTTELLMYRIGELERRQRPDGEAAVLFRDAVANLAYVFVPIAAGLFAIAPSFLSLLYTPKFLDAAPILRLALGMVVLACLPVDGVLRAKAKTRALLAANVAKLGLTVPLVVGLNHAFGPVGAMAGFVLTETVHRLVLLALAARALVPSAAAEGRLRGTLAAVGRVLPGVELVRAAVAAAGAGLVALFAGGYAALDPLPSVLVLGTGFWIAYFGALVLVGVRPSAVLARIRG
ncbi:lipopolysaccharide biosynthesis protein [Vulgatibacter incomptus]|nr:oligosaccharide flippase family protein [Vulgatibacter incomptus]